MTDTVTPLHTKNSAQGVVKFPIFGKPFLIDHYCKGRCEIAISIRPSFRGLQYKSSIFGYDIFHVVLRVKGDMTQKMFCLYAMPL